LISYCGSLEAVFQTKKKILEKIPGCGEKIAATILKKAYFKEAEKELRFIEKQGIEALFFLDKNFPKRLKPFDDAPLLLYYKGSADLNHPRIISIVGTRKPSEHSKSNCEELIAELEKYDVLISSGLAYGIDVTAHKKCLDLGIQTVGVLGHGLSQIYPNQHRQIALKMIEHGGLLTEFSSDLGPETGHFPMRNRIVAAMCDALIVVETNKKGGSMITAQYANEYSKDVFALPGRIKDAHLQGCNHLIKTHRAALIENAADIAYIMRWEELADSQSKKKQTIELDEEEKLIFGFLSQTEEIEIDNLTFKAKLSPNKVASLLLTLEFKGLVKSLPGKRYILI
jgi:DNA processing protein